MRGRPARAGPDGLGRRAGSAAQETARFVAGGHRLSSGEPDRGHGAAEGAGEADDPGGGVGKGVGAGPVVTPLPAG
jgi:hypothetical protein